MNRPLASPLLPLAGKDAFNNDLLRALNPFHIEIVAQLNSQVQGLGSVLPSGDSIYVTSPIHHVSGTNVINTIEAPGGFTGPVWLIADDAWSLGVVGNIAAAKSPTPNSVVMVVYDGSRWFPG